MKRRQFLKLTLGAVAAAPVLANAKGLGSETPLELYPYQKDMLRLMDHVSSGGKVYVGGRQQVKSFFGQPIISQDKVRQAQAETNKLMRDMLDASRVLDAANIPKHNQTVAEWVIDPITFKRVTRIRRI